MQLHNRASERPPRASIRVLPPPAAVDHPEVLSSAAEPDLSTRAYLLALGGILAIAFVLRLAFTLRSDFPLNDGALFYAMVRDIQNNGYALPAFTSFDNAGIPFGYPPFAFYLAAAVDRLTPMGLLGVFRWLPLAGSTLLVVAFAPLARAFTRTRLAALTASLIFAMLGPAFVWMVMGGGLTRSFGFVFAILTIWQAREMYLRRSYWRIAVVSACAALTLATHLEMAWLAAISCGLFFLVYGRHRAGFVCSAGVAAGALALSAPWWATVLAQHGLEPFRAALGAGSYTAAGPILLIQYNVAIEPLFAVIGALGLLGVVASLARRQYVLPLWLAAVAILDARAFATSSTLPLALLASVGLHDVLLPAATRPFGPGSLLGRSVSDGEGVPMAPILLPGVVATIVICYAILSAFITAPKLLTGLTPEERAAMTWAGQSTPVGSRFAVITGDGWAVDRTSEWLPVISGRESVATVQGWEWVSGQFQHRQDDYATLQDCALADGDCVYAWSAASAQRVDYVYIARIAPRVPDFQSEICCASLRLALARDPRFAPVFNGPGATIYQLLERTN